MQAACDQLRVRGQVARRIAQQQRGERRIVVDDNPALPVENLPPRSQNRDIAYAVLFRERRIEVALHHLQPPQSVGQNQENGEDDVLHRGQADGRNFFVAAEHRTSGFGHGFYPKSLPSTELFLSGSCPYFNSRFASRSLPIRVTPGPAITFVTFKSARSWGMVRAGQA